MQVLWFTPFAMCSDALLFSGGCTDVNPFSVVVRTIGMRMMDDERYAARLRSVSIRS